MKRYISTILMTVAAVVLLQVAATEASAQGRSCEKVKAHQKNKIERCFGQRGYQQTYYGNRGYGNRDYNDPYYNAGRVYNDPYYDPYYNGQNNGTTVYDRHRKAINIAVGTGVGAAVGAMVGGTKGAAIGAAAGAIGGAIVTAAQAPRNYPRY